MDLKTLMIFLLSLSLIILGVRLHEAKAASKVLHSAVVKVSCNTDGTLNINVDSLLSQPPYTPK